jgi:hypothetical protein
MGQKPSEIYSKFIIQLNSYLESLSLGDLKESVFNYSKELFQESIDKKIPLLVIENKLRNEIDIENCEDIAKKISRDIYKASQNYKNNIECKNNPSDNNDNDDDYDRHSAKKRNIRYSKLNNIWKEIVDLINIKQLQETMGHSNFKEKAIIIKTVSKSKKVHKLANKLIMTYDEEIHNVTPIRKINPSHSNPMTDWLPVIAFFGISIYLLRRPIDPNLINNSKTSVIGVRG